MNASGKQFTEEQRAVWDVLNSVPREDVEREFGDIIKEARVKMAKYRKAEIAAKKKAGEPIEPFQAIRWTGKNFTEIVAIGKKWMFHVVRASGARIVINKRVVVSGETITFRKSGIEIS